MNLFDQKREILNLYQCMIDDKNHLFSENQINELLQQKEQLEDEKFSIVVAGRFSAGKSLLINRAFLRDDILPYKNEPVTCHPVHIHYGDKCQLILRDNVGGVQVVEENSGNQDDKFIDIKNTLQRYGAHYGDV